MIGLVKRFKKVKSGFVVRAATITAAAFIFIAALGLLWMSSWRVPTIDSFEERRVSQSTKIYDRTGEILLYDVFQDIKRTVIPFEEISPFIKGATLAIEDTDFYKHKGIKPTSIVRAVIANITGFSFNQGGSTITQQVVKNSLLTGEKKISRKLKEWVIALKLEKILSKDQIFSMYLNEIPYGGSLYGIEEASNAYFGKSASEVTLAEAAYLAALPKAPTFYSPYGKNRERLDERKNLVLREMLENNFIDENEFKKASEEKVTFQPQTEQGIKAPHFVLFVRDQLVQKYGERVLEEGGLRVITTLDYELQKKAEDEAKVYALKNSKDFDAENVGLVAVNPKNGDILMMVGSRDYFDETIDGNFNITTAKRQPGSAFKPFAYAEAFKKGYTPETVLFDLKTEFSTTCSPDGKPLSSGANCYSPENYDLKYRGPTMMKEALAQSINVPSVKTLYLAGLKDTLRLAKDMGISSLTNINQYGLTLVLGGGEVTPLDITSAYGVFANNGVKNPYRAILEVKNQRGETIDKAKEEPTTVLNPEIAQSISQILSDEQLRAPAFGYSSPLHFPGRDVAVKTGTTNDYRDAWIIGYTPDIAIGAWAGNNDNRPMQKKIAAFIIAPFWHSIMAEALKKVPDNKFIHPVSENSFELKPVLRGKWQGGASTLVDKISGNLATEYTPPEALDEVLTGGVHSILYWVDKENPRAPKTSSPDSDPQFKLWEHAVRNWVQTNGIMEFGNEIIPTQQSTTHSQNSGISLEIINPNSTSAYDKDQKLFVNLNLNIQNPIYKIEYFLNNIYIGSVTPPLTIFSFVPADMSSLNIGTNSLRVVVRDSIYNSKEKTVSFTVND